MSEKNSPLFRAIGSYLSGKKVDFKEEDIKKNTQAYSLFAKLVRDRESEEFTSGGELTETTPSLDYLLSISTDKAQDIDDNEAIMQLLPDITRAAQILISYTLSPTFISPEPYLQYLPPENLFNQSIGKEMIETVQDYMNKGFGLDGRLYDLMYKILFTKGAYVVAVIPESSLDELINPEVAKESYSTQLFNSTIHNINNELDSTYRPCYGFAGKPTLIEQVETSTENYTVNNNTISVTFGDSNNPTKVKTIKKLVDTKVVISHEVFHESQ